MGVAVGRWVWGWGGRCGCGEVGVDVGRWGWGRCGVGVESISSVVYLRA